MTLKKEIPEKVLQLIKDSPGVELHGDSLRVLFSYRGQRCRPRLSATTVNQSSVMNAVLVLKAVKQAIRENRFDYATTFPNCPRAKLFSREKATESNRTVEEGVNAFLDVCHVTKAKTTYDNYKSKSKRVTARWPADHRIKDILKSDIESFQASLLKSGLSAKTTNDIFTIVRAVWDTAFNDEIISINPLQRIRNIEIDPELDDEDEFVHPFTRDEMDRIANTVTRVNGGAHKGIERSSEKNAILFNCWTGLSMSELLALAWEDVDTTAWTATVRRACVDRQYKVPKERVRRRVVEILGPARKWILAQKLLTSMLPTQTISVVQRDNVSVKHRDLRLVFNNSHSGGALHAKAFQEWFATHLRKAGVTHRGPNQCRHTYASQLLSSYVDREYVRQMMGHSDFTMLNKNYSRFIPSDTPSMADHVTRLLGFADDDNQINKLKVVK